MPGKRKRRGDRPLFVVARIDGSTPQSERFERIKARDSVRCPGVVTLANACAWQKFNDLEGSDLNVMLVSTKAGGEGINLVGASRVVLFDVMWNPCHDYQVGRQHVWRFVVFFVTNPRARVQPRQCAVHIASDKRK